MMDSRGSPRDVRDGRAGSVTARRLCDGYAEMEMASSFGTRVEISSFSLAEQKTLTVS